MANYDGLNSLILSELVTIGKMIFEDCNGLQCNHVKGGTFTASELANKKQNKHDIMFVMDRADELVHIEIDRFKCTFKRENIFDMIHRFEKLCGIGAKNKTRFTRIEESGKKVASFMIHITKKHQELKKFVSTDVLRPSLCSVYLDADLGVLVATNGRILKEMPINIQADELPENTSVYINPKDLANLVGWCSVDIIERDGTLYYDITNESNQVFTTKNEGRFPAFRKVYPNVSKDGYFRIAQSGIKELKAFLKGLKKKHEPIICLSYETGANTLKIAFRDEWKYNTKDVQAITVNLDVCPAVSFMFGVRADMLNCFISSFDGGIWFSAPDVALLVDDSDENLGLIMPAFLDNAETCGRIKERNIKAIERFKKDDDTPEPTKEQTPECEPKNKPESKPITKNVPTLYIAPMNQVQSYIGCLCDAVDAVSKSYYLTEIERLQNRLNQLQKLVGDAVPECAVPDAVCTDVAPDCVPDETDPILPVCDVQESAVTESHLDAEPDTPICENIKRIVFISVLASVFCDAVHKGRILPVFGLFWAVLRMFFGQGSNRIRDMPMYAIIEDIEQ